MDEMKKTLLKAIPKTDEVLNIIEKEHLCDDFSRPLVTDACRAVIGDIRDGIMKGRIASEKGVLSVGAAAGRVAERLRTLSCYSLRRVVNATGIVLHTNLGRAPLCEKALAHVVDVSRGYSNLEFNLEEGRRGLRYDHVRRLLCAVTGAEDAVIVNNNAAAVLLVLNTLSEGKETVVSRGELVEIGGEFRIPEIMEKSGAVLREVGTTNRTHPADYERATGPATGLILKVHTSNFRTVGFVQEVGLPELVALGGRTGIAVVHDLGSGSFIGLDDYGFEREPTVQDALATGVDAVTFSGDKLLGGPQAGIILGRNETLERIKKNPLMRALRIDKLTLAALEGTLMLYLSPDRAVTGLRVLKALTEDPGSVEARAKKLVRKLKSRLHGDTWNVTVRKGSSLAGGGALPMQEIPTALVVVACRDLSAAKLEKKFRELPVPVIARIVEDKVAFDMRTVEEEEFPFILKGLANIAGKE